MTLVMGIVNVTDDSLSLDGALDPNDIYEKIQKLIKDGADIIDIGAESTRPGFRSISEDEEISRLSPVFEMLPEFNVPISIDTTKSIVAEMALKKGATYINDVSGMQKDKKMKEVVKGAKVILMHSARESENTGFKYKNINSIICDLKNIIDDARHAKEIILDPGIGFGGDENDSISIIKNVGIIKQLGFKVLIGASRKSFIGKITRNESRNRIGGSICAHVIASLYGADMVRVHDVFETKQALNVLEELKKA